MPHKSGESSGCVGVIDLEFSEVTAEVAKVTADIAVHVGGHLVAGVWTDVLMSISGLARVLLIAAFCPGAAEERLGNGAAHHDARDPRQETGGHMPPMPTPPPILPKVRSIVPG